MSFENTTFYIIPLSVEDMTAFTEHLLKSEKWEREEKLCRPNYLLHYAHSLATDPSRFRVLRYRETERLPICTFQKTLNYSVSPRITDIYLCAFGTGVCFLEYRVAYGDMPLSELMDFAYTFKKADGADRKKLLSEGEISLMTASKQILDTEKTKAKLFFAYHNEIQSNCICYHLIRLSKEQTAENDIDRLCFYLKRSYDSAYLYDKDNDSSEYDMIYKPYYYMVWAGCQEGLVMLTTETDVPKTNFFIENYYFSNLISDYHFMYLMLLNQRFGSLKCIDALAAAPDDRPALERISTAAADLATRYAFYVISDEMVYQNIYSDLYRIFHIDKLLADVKECGERMAAVQSAAAERHEKTTSRLLFALSCLTAFSALVDATGYFDRLFPWMGIATAIGTLCVGGVLLVTLGKNFLEAWRDKRK